ncbi:hypothetical protein [Haloarchaeobius sp. TZWWS8]|uniref:hypothetical protein n=1 Tax=Haloarchaeobius sp. TZWWS8 TaxID=3446121 RepID=UPI003EC057A0
MSTRPTVTVGVTPRHELAIRTLAAGVVSGSCIIGAVHLWSVEASALGTSFELGANVTQLWFWHLLFSGLFGGVFGVLVHSRPLWRYGRGFLGPLVGGVFGVLAWFATAALLEPLWLAAHGMAPWAAVPVVDGAAFTTYVVYGGLVGFVSNLWL